MIKKIIKKLIPKFLWNRYHFVLGWLGALIYGFPSEKLKVIGITGTGGKSTTIYFLRKVLEEAGFKVGSISTIDFYIAGKEEMNAEKMTMLGRFKTQKLLKQMVEAKCDYAIVETTSQGVLQYRHKFINYDVAVLTNLWEEHIEAHGGFENYKKAKLKFFQHVSQGEKKSNKSKVVIVNANNEYSSEFLQYKFDQRYIFGRGDKRFYVDRNSVILGKAAVPPGGKDLCVKTVDQCITGRHSLKITGILEAYDIDVDKDGINFKIEDIVFYAKLFGEYNVMNLLCVASICRSQNISLEIIKLAFRKFTGVPGRVEFIENNKDFQIIIDYAFEPIAMHELYKIVEIIKPNKIIHVLGSTGGDRDVARRFTIGELVGEKADFVIVTDEDPYDTPPQKIIDDVASSAIKAGKQENKDLWKILDRREAIRKALNLAQAGDLVLITGKGCEQAMCVGDKRIFWDERKVVREELGKI